MSQFAHDTAPVARGERETAEAGVYEFRRMCEIEKLSVSVNKSEVIRFSSEERQVISSLCLNGENF